MYNDQLLQLERAFLNPLGQGPDKPDVKHIVYAPATNDMYEAAGFPTISDAIVTGDQIIIEQQVAIATYFTRGAVSVLKDFGKFIF
ncbi:unnamed protein product [Rotaria sp. Silwood1]|nr:unnamed protein product [Rotaria sp. Silwood1]